MSKPIKQIIKRGIQHAAARLGAHTRTGSQPRLLILMYHRILPADDPRAQLEEPGMMVTPATFDLHLELLQQYFSIVSLSDWLHRKQSGKTLPDNACAITFDDGWVDNYQFALPLLKQHNVPATVFLVADMIGTRREFWPGRLARLISSISTKYPQHWQAPELQWLNYSFSNITPSQETISRIIAGIKQYSDAQIHQHIDDTEAALNIEYDDSSATLLNWDQVIEMQNSGLVEFGSHTCNHVRLNQDIDADTLQTEIVDSKRIIEHHTGTAVTTFCYPNGDLCEAAIDLVAQTYDGAVTTRNGWNNLDSNPFQLQRTGVHEDISHDRTAFLARLSGWI